MPNRPLAHRSSRASRSGGSARWASAITRTGACSSWSRAKAPPVRKERPKKLPAFVSGSVTSRWRPSRSRPSPCSAPAAPCALGAGCQWTPPAIPARSRTVPARSSDPSTAEAERLLARLPEMRLAGVLHGASNYTFLATLAPHPPDGLRVVYKPARGASPLWDFQTGTLSRRAVAAYQLSNVLRWPAVSPPIVRPPAPPTVAPGHLSV